jgi:hypothetical protein
MFPWTYKNEDARLADLRKTYKRAYNSARKCWYKGRNFQGHWDTAKAAANKANRIIGKVVKAATTGHPSRVEHLRGLPENAMMSVECLAEPVDVIASRVGSNPFNRDGEEPDTEDDAPLPKPKAKVKAKATARPATDEEARLQQAVVAAAAALKEAKAAAAAAAKEAKKQIRAAAKEEKRATAAKAKAERAAAAERPRKCACTPKASG